MRHRVVQYALVASIAMLAPCGLVRAQVPDAETPASPRFEIVRFEVVGNTVLKAAEIDAAVAAYVGADKDFADIQRALESLEQVYRDRGYGVAQVMLPEQDITRGVVRLRVIEPKVGKVIVEGNKYFDESNVRRSLPKIRQGEMPNSQLLARNLQLLAEHPAKQTSVLLKGGAAEDQVDVSVKVEDDRPWRVILSLDDTGTSDTGYWRSGIGLQHTNLFNRDHSLTFQYITSPTKADKVSIYGLGYHIPFYGLNSSLDLIAGYSDVNSGMVQGLFSVAGSGTIFGVHWNYVLPKWGELEQKLTLGVDYRALKNDVSLAGQGGLVPDITFHPASLTYTGTLRTAASQLNFYASAAANISGGNDGTSADFQRSRAGATDNYRVFRYGLGYTKSFAGDWQAHVAVNGQHTSDALVVGEQFGLGGPDSVRGYLLREVANDRGYSGQFELFTPDVARMIKLPGGYRARLLAFYDFGDVSRNKALPGEQEGQSIASTGAGVRMYYAKNVSFRIDVAQILKSAGTRQSSNQRISTALVLSF